MGDSLGRLVLVVVCFAVVVLAAQPCSAQARGTVELTPVAGAYFSTYHGVCYVLESGEPLGCPTTQTSGFAIGGRVTRWMSRWVAAEGSVWYSPSISSDHILAGTLRLQLRLFGGAVSWAYVAGGPEFTSHYDGGNTDIGFGGMVGGGVRLGIAPRLALRAEFEEFITPRRFGARWDPFLSLGMAVTVAGKRIGGVSSPGTRESVDLRDSRMRGP